MYSSRCTVTLCWLSNCSRSRRSSQLLSISDQAMRTSGQSDASLPNWFRFGELVQPGFATPVQACMKTTFSGSMPVRRGSNLDGNQDSKLKPPWSGRWHGIVPGMTAKTQRILVKLKSSSMRNSQLCDRIGAEYDSKPLKSVRAGLRPTFVDLVIARNLLATTSSGARRRALTRTISLLANGLPQYSCPGTRDMFVKTIYINGKFFCQQTTGTQRYAHELLNQFDKLLSEEGNQAIAVEILVPRCARSIPRYTNLRVRFVGQMGGTAWEQLDLPRFCDGKLLFTLSGGAPVLHPRNVVTIHDAAVVASPAGYSRAYRMWLANVCKRMARKAQHIL